jgi:hypothetical protein
MLAPLPLEQARTSLAFWRGRRTTLPFYRRAERREADEMIHRWQARVAAAERVRFGTGMLGFIRRLVARESPFAVKRGAIALAWSMVPRRLVVVFVATTGAFMVASVALGLALTILVLRAI